MINKTLNYLFKGHIYIYIYLGVVAELGESFYVSQRKEEFDFIEMILYTC